MNENAGTDIIIKSVSTDQELIEILQLQKRNLAHVLSAEEVISQGFVTVSHTLEILRRMHSRSPSLVAVSDQHVIGYALVMTDAHRSELPVLEPMFRLLGELEYDNTMISRYNYFVMGQVCIEKSFRGKGVFDRLYHGLRQHLSGEFELLITEVAARNQRSMHAHRRLGLQTLHAYRDPAGEDWEILIWDWRKSVRNAAG